MGNTLKKAKTVEKQKKAIVFTHYLYEDKVKKTIFKPKQFDCIELICENYLNHRVLAVNMGKHDLMFAYKVDKRDRGILFLGNFNDGVV